LGKKFQKKIQNFGKDFNVKSQQKTKLKKKQKIQFFSKENLFFYFFSNSYFVMENRQIESKTSQKWQKYVFTSHL
jgi:hypothetical protein